MLCSTRCRVLEQQLLHWHGAGQQASGVLCSNQPEGLITRKWSSMQCIVLCRSRRQMPPSPEQCVVGAMVWAGVQCVQKQETDAAEEPQGQ